MVPVDAVVPVVPVEVVVPVEAVVAAVAKEDQAVNLSITCCSSRCSCAGTRSGCS